MAGGDEVRFVPWTNTVGLVARLLKLMTAFVNAVPGVPVKVWPNDCPTTIPDMVANKTTKSVTPSRRWLRKNIIPTPFLLLTKLPPRQFARKIVRGGIYTRKRHLTSPKMNITAT